ncbi:hypothetical protein BV25DRAFT_949541 [Artomyces pyxidatus]|uniref:Uncharacterized protein n=1 Tax=Artomyces pyxidatus TaxID=48021 RepID=A0ACB8SWP3_9AGAM|nr:hypothetical protein BV25DRAFT_949541 [Artomyces pyxidatus]
MMSPQESPQPGSNDAMASLGLDTVPEHGQFQQNTGPTYYNWNQGSPYDSHFTSSPASGGSTSESPVHYKADAPHAMQNYTSSLLTEQEVLNWSMGPGQGGVPISTHATPSSYSLPLPATPSPQSIISTSRRRSSSETPRPSHLSDTRLATRSTIGKRKASMRRSETTSDGENDVAEEEHDSGSDAELQKQKKKVYAKRFRDGEKQLFADMRRRLFPQDPHTKRSECLEKGRSRHPNVQSTCS